MSRMNLGTLETLETIDWLERAAASDIESECMTTVRPRTLLCLLRIARAYYAAPSGTCTGFDNAASWLVAKDDSRCIYQPLRHKRVRLVLVEDASNG